jgi:hypothetical protein
LTLAILVIFGGYTIASYGWVLLRGWDITAKQWIDPLHPYQWDLKPVPKGQLFPGVTGGITNNSD